MDLTQLANLGEFIGGVAVLVTLIYLAAQVKQGNRLARVQVHQETSRISSELAAQLSRDDVEILLKGATDWDQLSPVEQTMAILRFVSGTNYYETLYYARERGDVDDDLWASRVARMRRMFVLFAPMWSEHRETFGKRFCEFVEAEVLPNVDTEALRAQLGRS